MLFNPNTGPDRRKNSRAYINMVSLAISVRTLDHDLPRGFRLCMPRDYVKEVASHFGAYTPHILGTCFTLAEDCYVDFYPKVAV